MVEQVNKMALDPGNRMARIYYDNGATRHVFYDRRLFKSYSILEKPIRVNGFGSNLSTIAKATGSVELKATVGSRTHTFTLTDVLHIPDSRCNLVSGIKLDYKGVHTSSGDQKIALYMGIDAEEQ